MRQPGKIIRNDTRAVAEAKERAKARVAAEKTLPRDLLYVKGWPTRLITDSEARLLAQVRTKVCAIAGIPGDYLEADLIRQRYADLLAERKARESRKAGRNAAPECDEPDTSPSFTL